MRYVKWGEKEIAGLRSVDEMVALYTEVDDKGSITREIGVNKDGRIVHKCPSDLHRHGTYGFFDLQRVVLSAGVPDISQEEFNKLWEASVVK